MKPKIILALLLSWTMAAVAQAEGRSTLFVNLKDGTKAQFVLPVQKPVVTCYDGTMYVDYQDRQTAYPYSVADAEVRFSRDEVESLTVGTALTTGLCAAPTAEPRVSFDLTRPAEVHVSGLTKGDRLQVFALDGKQQQVPVAMQGSEAVADLSGLSRGLYVVSVNQRFTFKLMKP